MKRTLLLFFIYILFVVSCAPAQSVVMPTEIIVSSNTPTLIPARTSVVSTEDDDMDGISSIPSKTPIPPTIIPTFTITPTSTPQPPLTEHQWNPETVLISMRESMGDGGGIIGDLGPPPFILYADGSLFILNWLIVDDEYRGQVLTKKLNRLELCKHINTLDQIGFLDYLPSDYSFIGGESLVDGASSVYIAVNKWKSQSGDYYGLSLFLEDNIVKEYYGQNGYPIISPALRTAHRFLDQYPSQGLEVYSPERVVLWIVPAEYYESVEFSETIPTWQLESPSLKTLIERADTTTYGEDMKSIILDGSEAKSVYQYFGNAIVTRVFEQEMPDGTKEYYALKVRPLLPYELLGEYRSMSQIPAQGSPKPNFKLSCYPSDGVLPIPASLNP
jgi:hypothetical protein